MQKKNQGLGCKTTLTLSDTLFALPEITDHEEIELYKKVKSILIKHLFHTYVFYAVCS